MEGDVLEGFFKREFYLFFFGFCMFFCLGCFFFKTSF